ncbi:MAG: EscU/YscU/HrcU family type III secretion system export apparatus switch protein [Chloroflexi bacterium]|nr:EscU/YscU/HrcU family type III secretion system export apparatus switch protein [Chloroflexota bacterium]
MGAKPIHPKRKGRLPQAAALGYNPLHDEAPRLLAAGEGQLAEQILALARLEGIPIREDPILVSALAGVDVGQVIPPELYAVVAEVLAYVYRIQKAYK